MVTTMLPLVVVCFTPPLHHLVGSTTQLGMGKGFNKAKNKQADLKREMGLAKKQNKPEDSGASRNSSKPLSAEEIKERNDRKRFDELLQRGGAQVHNDYSADGYLNSKQEEEEVTAARAGVDRIFEGDPAPSECYENLIDCKTEKIVAKKGAGRLAPWTANDLKVDETDYRVIVCDPRKQSDELHQAMKDLNAGLPKDMKDRLYYISADTPPENRRFMKKNGLQHLDVYCDSEDLDWMRAYTALGDQRWSMTMLVVAKGKVMKLAREVDIYNAARTVINAVKAMKSEEQ